MQKRYGGAGTLRHSTSPHSDLIQSDPIQSNSDNNCEHLARPFYISVAVGAVGMQDASKSLTAITGARIAEETMLSYGWG